MCFFKKQTITTRLVPDDFFSLINSSKQFKGFFENSTFTLEERSFISNRFLFPVITGVVTEFGGNTTVDISFKLSKRDKAGVGSFLFVIIIISLLIGIVSSDFILMMTLFCFAFVLCTIFLMIYAYNCRRTYKKICHLLDTNE